MLAPWVLQKGVSLLAVLEDQLPAAYTRAGRGDHGIQY